MQAELATRCTLVSFFRRLADCLVDERTGYKTNDAGGYLKIQLQLNLRIYLGVVLDLFPVHAKRRAGPVIIRDLMQRKSACPIWTG
jgi:hypothetical protein